VAKLLSSLPLFVFGACDLFLFFLTKKETGTKGEKETGDRVIE